MFGGSFAARPEARVAIGYWCEKLNLSLTNYAIKGAGFSSNTQFYNIQTQVELACSEFRPLYDIYLFWASTNDYTKANGLYGEIDDYTEKDGYNPQSLETQCGGMNYCFKRIREKNPDATILFFTSTGCFTEQDRGTNPNYKGRGGMNTFVQLQKRVCSYWEVPYFDLFNTLITLENWKDYVSPDHLHLNESGYELIKYDQAIFIARN